VSAFREAVAEMKDKGWRSEGRPEDPCPKCKQVGYVFYTTINGRTSGDCSVCAKSWPVSA
jgi:hypothetical protein